MGEHPGVKFHRRDFQDLAFLRKVRTNYRALIFVMFFVGIAVGMILQSTQSGR